MDPHLLHPGHAPTPFTADEIRIGCPAGRTITLLVETDGDGPATRFTRFLECDADRATIEATRLTTDGEPAAPVRVKRVTWRELQGHASFPIEQTGIRRELAETPLGVLDCLRYTVTNGRSMHTFWFAVTKPGMPIRFTEHEGGRLVSTVTMVADELPG